MKNKLFYILGLSTAMLSSCHDDDMADMFLNGKEKTPLPVSVSLDTRGSVQTRAADRSFAVDDELLVYIQHMKSDGPVAADMAPALVKFKVTSGTMTEVDDHTQKTSNLTLLSIQKSGTGSDLKETGQTTLFWDDFSDSSSDETDLRTSGHGLRPYYGYCYNGGSPVTDTFVPTTGVLQWTVATDQTSGIKPNDLLWSGTPLEYVSYSHELDANGNRAGLTIPYTHAMSKVTIVLVAGEGFAGEHLNAATVKLQNMYTTCKTTAPTSEISETNTEQNISMFGHTDLGSIEVNGVAKPARSFEAIVVPKKELTKDYTIAVVEGMDGNKYNITATESIISQFLHQNTTGYQVGDKVTFESGKNYKLTIRIDKQPQTIEAKITDWKDVEATGTGDIQFANDVVVSAVTGPESADHLVGSFDLWRSKTNTNHASYDEDADATGVNKATTVTYYASKWLCDPKIYWPNGNDSYYFRALAKFVQVEEQRQLTSVDGSSSIAQGTDIVWGTTSAHTGKEVDGTTTHSYDEGQAINPRTGDVPMTFYHAMSKISVKLETSTGADAVDLAGAKISIANIYDGGTIDLTDGSIHDLSFKDDKNVVPISGFYAADRAGTGDILKEYVVIPQSLVETNEGTARDGNVSFYNKAELTIIEGVSYVTSTLDKENYTDETAAEYNATLQDAVSNGDNMSYTEAQFKALTNSEIPVDLFNLFNFGCTYEDFVQKEEKPFMTYSNEDYETILTIITGKGLKHNDRSAKAYNAKLPGAVKDGDLKGYSVNGETSKKANPGDLKSNGENPVIKMLIMLADGTTYTLNLANCITIVDGVEKKIDAWERGKHYTYTITLKKEEITFRAMIKDWDERKGGGNANLDWD